MSHKIQITVDDKLNKTIRERAKEMRLSVSSYVRLALVSALLKKNSTPLDEAMIDVNSNNVETLTLAQFNNQINDLL